MAKKKRMNILDWITLWLLTIGGINWGLVGLFNFDLVQLISFGVSWLPKVIYSVVGLSAVYVIIRLYMIK